MAFLAFWIAVKPEAEYASDSCKVPEGIGDIAVSCKGMCIFWKWLCQAILISERVLYPMYQFNSYQIIAYLRLLVHGIKASSSSALTFRRNRSKIFALLGILQLM